MTETIQLQLSRTRQGRIELHLLSFLKDHKFKWHWKGILREVKKK